MGCPCAKTATEVKKGHDIDCEQNPTRPTSAMSYTLVSTEQAALQASLVLCPSFHIFVDCEGENLGCEGGALRLISVGTMGAQHVFLFDVAALQRIALEPLFDLLRNPRILKIVWDGRLDCLELRRTYGVELQGVLDLQLADIASRAVRGVSDRSRKYNRGHPLNLVKFLDTEGIYGLSSLKRVLDEHDFRRTAPRNSNVRISHDRWMQRPLPQEYLRYAAGDIYELALVFSFFQSRWYVGSWLFPKPELEEQSARYVNIHAGRPIQQGNIYQSSNLCPLDILTVPAGPRSQCNKCRRMLSRACFLYKDGPVRGPIDVTTAHTSCKVCYLLEARVAESGGPFANTPSQRASTQTSSIWARDMPSPEPADDFDPDYYEDTPYDYINGDSYPDDQADDYRRASYLRDSEY